MQLDLIEPLSTDRKAERKRAAAEAKQRAELGMTRASDKADNLHAAWCATALEKLRSLAKQTHPGLFTIEQARLAINFPIPPGGDLRAWGTVTRRAIQLGYIERVRGRTLPADSSNGSEKPLFRKGPKA